MRRRDAAGFYVERLSLDPAAVDLSRLICPAEIDGLEYAYLAGGPQIETKAGWDIDGVEIRVLLDFGAGFIGIKLEEDKAFAGVGGGEKLKIVPYVVQRLSFGRAQEESLPGLYDGPFPWENLFGFHPAGMVGHDFFKRYAVTFDFENMKILLQ